MKLVTSIALKIVGIYCIIQSVWYVQPIINAFSWPNDDSSMGIALIIGSIITFILLIGIGIYLIVLSDDIAKKMVPSDSTVDILKTIGPRELQVVAFSVVGIVLISLAVSKLYHLGSNIYVLHLTDIDDYMRDKIFRESIAYAIGLITQLIIGIVLFVFGGSVSNLWYALNERFQKELNITKE